MHKVDFSIPSNEVFIDSVISNFTWLIQDYKYKHSIDNSSETNVKVVFENSKNNRLIEIKNEWAHTDYGFSIFIYNTLQKDQYNILVNFPKETLDKDCQFVKYISLLIESSDKLIDIIKGKTWENIGFIYFRIKDQM